MDCNKAQSLLGAWNDGELNALTAGRVRCHVRHCPNCAAEASELLELTAALRDAAPFGPESPHPKPRVAPLAWNRVVFASAGLAGALFLLAIPFYAGKSHREREAVHQKTAEKTVTSKPIPTVAVTPARITPPAKAAITPPLVRRKALVVAAKRPGANRVLAAEFRRERRRRLHRSTVSVPRPVTPPILASVTHAAPPHPAQPQKSLAPEIIQVTARDLNPAETEKRLKEATELVYVEVRPMTPAQIAQIEAARM